MAIPLLDYSPRFEEAGKALYILNGNLKSFLLDIYDTSYLKTQAQAPADEWWAHLEALILPWKNELLFPCDLILDAINKRDCDSIKKLLHEFLQVIHNDPQFISYSYFVNGYVTPDAAFVKHANNAVVMAKHVFNNPDFKNVVNSLKSNVFMSNLVSNLNTLEKMVDAAYNTRPSSAVSMESSDTHNSPNG